MIFKEIETKYNADNISLSEFTEFCRNRGPEEVIIASGYDHFYAAKTANDSFFRHRVGPDINQLTFKCKTTDNNNFVRTEHNMDLGADMTSERVKAYVSEFGYEYNTSLFKSCFAYKYDVYTFVYYIVYDIDMKELGRFIEIEMREDYEWSSESEAWGNLLVLEKLCKPLKLTAQARLKRSLFELYRK